MTRKKDRRNRPNPFLDEDRKALLDELGNVQELLDGDQGPEAGDEEVPLLEPEAPATPEAGGEEQIPLLGDGLEESAPDSAPAPATPGQRTSGAGMKGAEETGAGRDSALKARLRKRENPFLAGHSATPGTDAPRRNSVAEDLDALLQRERANAETPPPSPEPTGSRQGKAPARLTEAQIRALVDEVLAEWMPRLERELRDRLTRRLRSDD